MNKCLPCNNLKPYLKKLLSNFLVYFPVKINQEIFFTSDKNLLDKFYPGLPQIPPKNFFLPHNENILYDNKVPKPLTTKSSGHPTIIFAIHPLDIHALTILDKIFLKKYSDFYYNQRRKNVYIVGLGPYTFDTDFNCDLFLEENGDTYEVILKNKKADFLLDYDHIFTKSIFDFDTKEHTHKKEPLFNDPNKIAQAIKSSYHSSIWDDLAQIELGCGICNYSCPLHYSYKIEDTFCFNKPHTTCRTRTWTNNFQSDLPMRDKIYNWYYDKFVKFYELTGHIGCIDCGRCIKYCPAKINFKHVLKTILNDYDKSLSTQKK